MLAVFEDHVFLFFDRESRKFDKPTVDTLLAWERWEKEAVQRQIVTAAGAKRYVLQHPDGIYLDARQTARLPIKLAPTGYKIHKIIVAHGAKEACEQFSEQNVSGSLAVAYGNLGDSFPFPFMVSLDKNDAVHVFDSHNLKIIFSELDTFYDFVAYLMAKEQAIQQFDCLCYCGEEDLLAHYFLNFDGQAHFIGTKEKNINAIFISQGEWSDFIKSGPYQRRKRANVVSHLWDELIQRTCQNALEEKLLGNANLFDTRNAIHEMAKEPRFSRRALSEGMINAIERFPTHLAGLARNVTFMPSFYKDKGYVFLQIKHPHITDYEKEYRPRRAKMLEIACGAAKNKFPWLTKIIGIAIDAPKFAERNSEDFVLLDCATWPAQHAALYEEANKGFRFFETESLRMWQKTVSDFPKADDRA